MQNTSSPTPQYQWQTPFERRHGRDRAAAEAAGWMSGIVSILGLGLVAVTYANNTFEDRDPIITFLPFIAGMIAAHVAVGAMLYQVVATTRSVWARLAAAIVSLGTQGFTTLFMVMIVAMSGYSCTC